jgi:hypothetical protein
MLGETRITPHKSRALINLWEIDRILTNSKIAL